MLATVQSLLDAIPSKNIDKMLENTVPTAGTATMRGTDLTIQTIQSLCETIVKIPGDLEEKFTNPEVRISGNVAMVWATSEVKIDGKVAMAGTNALSLHNIDGKWKITSISDTAQ